MADPYEFLGRGYVNHRRPDPRIAEIIETALGTARTVVNVGAGTSAGTGAQVRDVGYRLLIAD